MESDRKRCMDAGMVCRVLWLARWPDSSRITGRLCIEAYFVQGSAVETHQLDSHCAAEAGGGPQSPAATNALMKQRQLELHTPSVLCCTVPRSVTVLTGFGSRFQSLGQRSTLLCRLVLDKDCAAFAHVPPPQTCICPLCSLPSCANATGTNLNRKKCENGGFSNPN